MNDCLFVDSFNSIQSVEGSRGSSLVVDVHNQTLVFRFVESDFIFNLLGFKLIVSPDTALKNLAISSEELTFTIPLIILPVTDILLAGLLVVVVTETVEFTLDEFTLVDIATFVVRTGSVGEDTFSLLVVVFPSTFVGVTVGVLVSTLTVSLAFLDFTFVNTARGVRELTSTGHNTIFPSTFVVVVVFLRVGVFTILLRVFEPNTFELVTVLVGQSTLVVLLVSQQFTIISTIDVHSLASTGDGPVGHFTIVGDGFL